MSVDNVEISMVVTCMVYRAIRTPWTEGWKNRPKDITPVSSSISEN